MYGVYFGQTCVLTIKVYAPPVWVVGGEGTSRGWIRLGGGSWNAERLVLQGW